MFGAVANRKKFRFSLNFMPTDKTYVRTFLIIKTVSLQKKNCELFSNNSLTISPEQMYISD